MKTQLIIATIVSMLAVGTAEQLYAGVVAPTRASQMTSAATDDATPCLATAGTYAVTRRLNPDGTVGAFSVPIGSVFVVTSVELRGNGGLAKANRSVQLSLFRESVGGASVNEGIVEYGTTNSRGLLSTWRPQVTMVLKSGARLCARADDLTDGTNFLALAVVHGFFASDK